MYNVRGWRNQRVRGVHARKRHGILAHAREYIWPSMGLAAFFRWAWLKLVRQAQDPHSVALGAALGILVAFFPILGTHMVLMVVICPLVGASFVAALLGSMVANPWTVGPMWAGSFHVGRWILGMKPASAHAVEHLNQMSWYEIWERLEGVVSHVILPTVVGGLALGGPLAVGVYGLVYWRLRVRRARKRL